jgi:hypothetical protein
MHQSRYVLPCTMCDAMLLIADEEDKVTADNYFQFADLSQSYRHVGKPGNGNDASPSKTISIDNRPDRFAIDLRTGMHCSKRRHLKPHLVA